MCSVLSKDGNDLFVQCWRLKETLYGLSSQKRYTCIVVRANTEMTTVLLLSVPDSALFL
jgi:hypothetical protein